MASLTVRQLDEKLKKLLRMRAARHGRSMEDEARTILRDAASLDDGKIEARAARSRSRRFKSSPSWRMVMLAMGKRSLWQPSS